MNRAGLCLLLVFVFPCYPIASPQEESVQLPACPESNNQLIIDGYYDAICARVTSAIEKCESDQQLAQSAKDGNVIAMLAWSKCNMDHTLVLPAYEWLVRGILSLKRDFACFKQAEQSDEIFEAVSHRLIDLFNERWDKKPVTAALDVEKRMQDIFKNIKELSVDPSWLQSEHLTLRDEKEWSELRAAALEQFRNEHNDRMERISQG